MPIANLRPIKKEPFNTNNGWGFGGGIGNEITYDNGLVNRSGKACFRHLPPENFNNWYIKHQGRMINVNGSASKSNGVYSIVLKYKGKEYDDSIYPSFIFANSEEEATKIFNKFGNSNYYDIVSVTKVI